MISCIKEDQNKNILDFGAGTCWISEWLNRMGFNVTAFDISQEVLGIGKKRKACDSRINQKNIHFISGDGHSMQFEDNTFSNICCFDTLHHMKDYPKVLSEFYRILIPNGRIIFVEPGSKHSKSKETIEFIKKYKSHDPEWVERDIILKEIYEISKITGFESMTIKPFLFPSQVSYNFNEWQNFKHNIKGQENLINNIISFNNESRIIFYLEK